MTLQPTRFKINKYRPEKIVNYISYAGDPVHTIHNTIVNYNLLYNSQVWFGKAKGQGLRIF